MNITDTCTLVTTMMNTDNVSPATQSSILSMVNLALNSNTYIASITQQVKNINADGKFNQNDIPAVLMIILQSKAFLQTAISGSANVATKFDVASLKYIVYAVIHFVMVAENVDLVVVQSIDVSFSSLWNLVAINPVELAADIKILTNKCFPCC
jgi:hypothetical protein